jgi:predicted MFS family arabinose efflux permease
MFSVAAGSALGGALPIVMSQTLSIAAAGALRPEQMPLAYRASILCAALILFLSALPLLLLKRQPAGDKRKSAILGFGRSVPWRRVLRLAFPLFVFGISGGWTFPFFNLIFRDLFGISDSAIGGVIGLGWLFMGLLPLLNPVWEMRLGRAGALTALMLASAVAFVGFSLSQALWIAVVFYVMAIGIRNTMQPLFQPLLMASLAAEYHNVASSVGLALWNMGWFVSALTFGWLQAAVGTRVIMLLVAVFVVLNGLTIHLTALRRSESSGRVMK